MTMIFKYISKNWNLISSYGHNIIGDIFHDTSNSFLNADESYNIFKYDNSIQRFNRISIDASFEQGIGYLLYANEDFSYNPEIDTYNAIDISFELKENWNLIGSPFNSPINLNNYHDICINMIPNTLYTYKDGKYKRNRTKNST